MNQVDDYFEMVKKFDICRTALGSCGLILGRDFEDHSRFVIQNCKADPSVRVSWSAANIGEVEAFVEGLRVAKTIGKENA